MQAVKQNEIDQILNSGLPLFTTIIPFCGQPYEQQVEVTISGNGNLYWRCLNWIPYYQPVETKKNSPFFYLGGQVLYIKPEYSF